MEGGKYRRFLPSKIRIIFTVIAIGATVAYLRNNADLTFSKPPPLKSKPVHTIKDNAGQKLLDRKFQSLRTSLAKDALLRGKGRTSGNNTASEEIFQKQTNEINNGKKTKSVDRSIEEVKLRKDELKEETYSKNDGYINKDYQKTLATPGSNEMNIPLKRVSNAFASDKVKQMNMGGSTAIYRKPFTFENITKIARKILTSLNISSLNTTRQTSNKAHTFSEAAVGNISKEILKQNFSKSITKAVIMVLSKGHGPELGRKLWKDYINNSQKLKLSDTNNGSKHTDKYQHADDMYPPKQVKKYPTTKKNNQNFKNDRNYPFQTNTVDPYKVHPQNNDQPFRYKDDLLPLEYKDNKNKSRYRNNRYTDTKTATNFNDNGDFQTNKDNKETLMYKENRDFPIFKDSIDELSFNDRREIPSFMHNKDTPRFKDNRDTPRFKDNRDMPRFKDNRDTPRFKDNRDIPRFKDNRDTPRFKDNRDTPRFKDNTDTPRIKDNRDMPRFKDNRYTPRFKDNRDTPRFKDYRDKQNFKNSKGISSLKDSRGTPRFRDNEDAPKYMENEDMIKYKDNKDKPIFEDNRETQKLKGNKDTQRNRDYQDRSTFKDNRDITKYTDNTDLSKYDEHADTPRNKGNRDSTINQENREIKDFKSDKDTAKYRNDLEKSRYVDDGKEIAKNKRGSKRSPNYK